MFARTARHPSRLVAASLLLIVIGSAACSRDPKVTKARYVESGDRYASESKFAEASLEYRNALQAEPLDGDVRLKLAETYAKLGQGRQAAQEYIRAADVLIDRPEVQVRAGSILLLSGRFDDARVRAEKALAVAPSDVEAQILLANALAGLKDLNAAVAEIEEAIKLQPDRSASYTNLGVIEVTRGKREAAEKAFKKAIELDGRSAPAHLALANFLWATGRQAEAAPHLAQALAADPDNPLVLRAMVNFAVA
jgi:tetratricopeptide (TPR) repeat protein